MRKQIAKFKKTKYLHDKLIPRLTKRLASNLRDGHSSAVSKKLPTLQESGKWHSYPRKLYLINCAVHILNCLLQVI